MTTRLVRFCVAAASSVILVLAVAGAAAWSQAAPKVVVDPNAAPPLATVTVTLQNFTILPQCDPKAPTAQTCIQVNFIQGTRVTPIATATGSGAAKVTIRGQCTAPTQANCVDPGIAAIRATSPNGQNAETAFTVQAAGATTTAPTTTTSTTSTTTPTTLLPPTTSTSTTSTTVASTTTTVKGKKDDEHSDVPRYIAVGLVVAAALATAIVDSRMRRMRG